MLPKVGKFIFLSGVLLLAAALLYSAYYKLPGAVWGAISFILCLGTGTAFFRPLPRTENKTPSEVREKALFVRLSGQKRFFVNANKCAPGDRAKVVSKNGKFYVYAGGMIIGTLSASNAKKNLGKENRDILLRNFRLPRRPRRRRNFYRYRKSLRRMNISRLAELTRQFSRKTSFVGQRRPSANTLADGSVLLPRNFYGSGR